MTARPHDQIDGQIDVAGGTTSPTVVHAQLSATERLVEVAQELSMARDFDAIREIVRRAARELTRADGATLVLRDGGSYRGPGSRCRDTPPRWPAGSSNASVAPVRSLTMLVSVSGCTLRAKSSRHTVERSASK
jgi:hypothetical protein